MRTTRQWLRGRPALHLFGAALALLLAGGCALPARLRAAERYEHGLIYVLPGIEGRSIFNRNIAIGLDEGGVRDAIEIFDWTYRIPGANVLNLIDIERNRAEASRIASRILAYRARYPGRPVHLIGHSAGAAMAVLALEALPAGRQIDSAILLAPALSPDYDLSVALRRARFGIVNFYSKLDFGLLVVGTTLVGTADREHGSSAGALGFSVPAQLSESDRRLYDDRLRQVAWDRETRQAGASGLHSGWTRPSFVSGYIAPIVLGFEARQLQFLAAASPPTASEAPARP